MNVTLSDLMQSKLRHIAFLDGPRGREGWFGDMHECLEHPRLQRRTQYFRRDRSSLVTWFVDGVEVGPDLAACVPLLNVPAVLTPEEQAAFDQVPDEYQDLRREGEITTLLMLRSKGMIEFQAGKCRRRAQP